MSAVSRLWPPALLGAISTVAAGFSINFLSNGKTAWWWLVLGTAALGLAVATVWTILVQKSRSDGATTQTTSLTQVDAGGPQQSTSGSGDNISINADNGSVAAWQIDNVSIGRRPKSRKPDRR
jgi:hypothetical protein